MQREPIYNALLQQLLVLTTSAYGSSVKVVSRGFVMWDTADQQPAIYIVPKMETAKYVRGTPVSWIILLDLYVYVRWADSLSLGVTTLSSILDQIDLVLSPVGPNSDVKTGSQVNTLGGLAHYCALQGSTEISGGFLNKSQVVARVPVEIVVPG